MSPVMPMLACPSTSETTLSGTPLTSITAAAEWRSVCKPMIGQAHLPCGRLEGPQGVTRLVWRAELGCEHVARLLPR